MSVHTLYDPHNRKSAMYCSTTGLAFGPIFDDDSAADFVDWMLEDDRDPRDMDAETLQTWVDAWNLMLEAEKEAAK